MRLNTASVLAITAFLAKSALAVPVIDTYDAGTSLEDSGSDAESVPLFEDIDTEADPTLPLFNRELINGTSAATFNLNLKGLGPLPPYAPQNFWDKNHKVVSTGGKAYEIMVSKAL